MSIHTKIGGVLKEIKPSAKVGNAIKDLNYVYAKVGGTLKEVYANKPPPFTIFDAATGGAKVPYSASPGASVTSKSVLVNSYEALPSSEVSFRPTVDTSKYSNLRIYFSEVYSDEDMLGSSVGSFQVLMGASIILEYNMGFYRENFEVLIPTYHNGGYVNFYAYVDTYSYYASMYGIMTKIVLE